MNDIQIKFQKGYKFEFYPTDSQKDLLANTFGCVRFTWNHILADLIKEYEHYKAIKNTSTTSIRPIITGFNLINKLVSLKSVPEHDFLNNISSVALQQTMIHLNEAFAGLMKYHRGYPNFKNKYSKQSFTLMTNSFRFIDSKCYIAKSKEPLNIVWSRVLPSDPSSATISKTASGRYYISFICEYIPEKTNGCGKIGIDLGIKHYLVISNGEKIDNPKHYLNSQKRLRRLQQSLFRKQKGSSNRSKSKLAVAKINEKVANQRNDFQHKLSRRLVNENQVIGLEKLKVSNMVKNHKLAKHITDAAWSSFTNKIQYKAKESQHCKIVYMDCWYPSTHICSACSTKLARKLLLSEREWVCPTCETKHDRDTNASQNISNVSLYTLKHFGLDKVSGHCVVLANYLQ